MSKRTPCLNCDAGYAEEACGRCFDCCWENGPTHVDGPLSRTDKNTRESE